MELEAIIWCPRCRTDKFEIRRKPTNREGVFENVTIPPSIPATDRKFCLCGAVLERKPR